MFAEVISRSWPQSLAENLITINIQYWHKLPPTLSYQPHAPSLFSPIVSSPPPTLFTSPNIPSFHLAAPCQVPAKILRLSFSPFISIAMAIFNLSNVNRHPDMKMYYTKSKLPPWTVYFKSFNCDKLNDSPSFWKFLDGRLGRQRYSFSFHTRGLDGTAKM